LEEIVLKDFALKESFSIAEVSILLILSESLEKNIDTELDSERTGKLFILFIER
jgi:hypothetical protein